ncbi:MAG: alkaline phosphatase family protein [Chitinophagaceae bacterium]|nr:alkaline phosphatase family protein [Chitinophagaceae bacterium]
MRVLLILCTFSLFFPVRQVHAGKTKTDQPALVVGIVVDQMRADYLYRYEGVFGNNGFKRLMREGHVCENTFIRYLPTYTGPGHAGIYTGSVPALHGIASNDWFERNPWRSVYCTTDTSVQAVGGNARAGKMSPTNLWATTITDELRLSSNFRSKVFAVSVKDRASILPGGHTANAAYWMDDSNGVFMSSTYYMNQLPKWVNAFNAKNSAKTYMDGNWNLMLPTNRYTQSAPDEQAYEGKFLNETNTSFPHKLSHLRGADIKKTPFGNNILADFAKQLVQEEQLGQGAATDFLCISFSSTDYVGHMYGPNALELEDTYARLDAVMADLLEYLDREVGQGRYTVFLTSDHGVAHNPQYLKNNKLPGDFFFGRDLRKNLNQQLATRFPVVPDSLIKEVGENYIWLNDALMQARNISRNEVVDAVMENLKMYPEIQWAVDMKKLGQTALPEPIASMAVHGYVAQRSCDILLLLKPGYLDAYSKTGSTHGTWNPFDARIPLLFYGWGIQPGITYASVAMHDIAATISSLLHIPLPNACIGQPIVPVIQK